MIVPEIVINGWITVHCLSLRCTLILCPAGFSVIVELGPCHCSANSQESRPRIPIRYTTRPRPSNRTHSWSTDKDYACWNCEQMTYQDQNSEGELLKQKEERCVWKPWTLPGETLVGSPSSDDYCLFHAKVLLYIDQGEKLLLGVAGLEDRLCRRRSALENVTGLECLCLYRSGWNDAMWSLKIIKEVFGVEVCPIWEYSQEFISKTSLKFDENAIWIWIQCISHLTVQPQRDLFLTCFLISKLMGLETIL